ARGVPRQVTARLVPLVVLVLAAAPAARAASDATEAAKDHYKMGLKLFESDEHPYEQALIEFQQANELKSAPAALFMMAQCEYLLGRLKEAKAHYERYMKESPNGEFVKLAGVRIESIDKRLSTFAINTVPDDITVSITPFGKTGPVITGQAPNN